MAPKKKPSKAVKKKTSPAVKKKSKAVKVKELKRKVNEKGVLKKREKPKTALKKSAPKQKSQIKVVREIYGEYEKHGNGLRLRQFY